MKNIVFLLFVLAGINLNAQKKTMPDVVLNAFETKYPMAEEVKFRVKKGDYNIKFNNENHQVLSIYNSTGIWIVSETSVKKNELPEKVILTLEKKYQEGKYSNGLFVEKNTGESYYQISIDTLNNFYTLEIDADGKILKTTKIEREKMPSPSRPDESGETGGEEG